MLENTGGSGGTQIMGQRMASCTGTGRAGEAVRPCLPKRAAQAAAFFLVLFFAGDSLIFCKEENVEGQEICGLRRVCVRRLSHYLFYKQKEKKNIIYIINIHKYKEADRKSCQPVCCAFGKANGGLKIK